MNGNRIGTQVNWMPCRALRTVDYVAIILLLATSVTSSVAAQEPSREGSSVNKVDLVEAEQLAFSAAASNVANCVVQIETFGGLERVGQELVADGPTTGTIVGADGWIISSIYNFRQQPSSILVSMPDGTRAPARIAARDYSRELVLLKVDAQSELSIPVPCPVEDVQVGQWAIALGRTFERDTVSQSVGIISALGRAYGRAIQTDAKISPVNYGGPLVDLKGRVIGILAPISPGAILEGDSSELYDSGIGFAVPLTEILKRLPQMQSGKDVRAGKLGVVVADQNELAGPVKVAGASPGSPAAKGGLKPGDVIIAAEDRPIVLLAHLRHALGTLDAGTKFRYTVLRNGKKIELESTLVDEVPTYRARYLGLTTENVEGGGVRIAYIWPESPAEKAKLSVGQRIVGCGDIEIKTSDELRQQVSISELDVPLKLKVLDKDETDSKNSKTIDVQSQLWPLTLEDLPASYPPSQLASAKIEEIELTLGDFPNKACAWCPEIATKKEDGVASGTKTITEVGLLIVTPEPGEVDRNKVRELWSPLIEQGWCVAVIQSEDKARWSQDEVELIERVRTQLSEKRAIDRARTVVAGQGAGGRLALIGSRASRGKVNGILLLATPLDAVRVRRENSPTDSMYFMLVGPQGSYSEFLKQLVELGYPASSIPVPDLGPAKWDSLPVERIVNWLVQLGRI